MGSGSAHLADLVRGFDRDPAESRKMIRVLAENDRKSFLTGALEVLRTQPDSRGWQHLVTQLIAHDLLVPALCDPALTDAQALCVARAAMRVDSMVDVALARGVAGAVGDDGPAAMETARRLLDILAQISDGSRILPSLMRLLRHANPYLRSKAVLMVGRSSRSVKWLSHKIQDGDPRIRANAVEALWGVNTEEARTLLQSAVRDGNNRVAGNALIALYRLGDCSTIAELIRMASQDSTLFRSTAAWVMGESGDPRFTETLAGMLRESDPVVRKRAFWALGRIKNAAAESARAGELRVGVRVFPSQKALRRLQVAVLRPDGAEMPGLLPTQFIVSEDGRQATSYRVEERPSVEAIAVTFMFPRSGNPAATPWTRGAIQRLAWKRPSDLWAAASYLEAREDLTREGTVNEQPPEYHSARDRIAASLEQSAARSDCSSVWNTLWRVMRPENGPARGRRHVILYHSGDITSVAGYGLISSMAASRASLQVIARRRCDSLEDFCAKARGSFSVAESDDEVERLVAQAYLKLMARYDIAYTPLPGEASTIKVRVQTPHGWGEAAVAT